MADVEMTDDGAFKLSTPKLHTELGAVVKSPKTWKSVAILELPVPSSQSKLVFLESEFSYMPTVKSVVTTGKNTLTCNIYDKDSNSISFRISLLIS